MRPAIRTHDWLHSGWRMFLAGIPDRLPHTLHIPNTTSARRRYIPFFTTLRYGTMRSFFVLASLLAYYSSLVTATALTYKLEAHEKACFFTNVEHKGTKVAFYFAVSIFGFSIVLSSLYRPLPTTSRRLGCIKSVLDGLTWE